MTIFKRIILVGIGFGILFFGCKNSKLSNPHPVDPHSFSNSNEAVTKHLDLDLEVNFETQTITGTAKWKIENNGANKIVFDTRDLKIKRISIETPKGWIETDWSIGSSEEFLGAPLIIEIQPTTGSLSIEYETSPGAAALLWMEPKQTLGKKFPFMFTQGQAVLTRSWIPCQDSPGVRVTYSAAVKVPPGMMALMSANNPQKKQPQGEYRFFMAKPIPPYLISLAVGDLSFGRIGDQSGVYAESEILGDALYEFAKVPEMMAAAEGLYGKYLWDRFDILVMPPSFPFGGMENPMLTFVNPTLIAGDRSLTSTIAHELAHSWSGNLVTNSTWNDFWLNEGFTVYLERRIIETVEGQPFANMIIQIGYEDLVKDVSRLDPEDTRLRLNLTGRDPDKGMTNVAYEKGAFFLEFIEEKVGRTAFDPFLKKYFQDHRFQSVSTDEFIAYANENLFQKFKIFPNIDEWIEEPGIPESCRKVNPVRFQIVDRVVEQVKAGENVLFLGIKGWSGLEVVHFIRQLPKDLDNKTVKRLDYTYHFSDSKNAEIQAAWFEFSIPNGFYQEIMPRIEEFLNRVGRRKFLTPIYSAFVKSGKSDQAREIYEKARPGYHAISRQSLDELLDY